jgi:hypothetical protein
MLDWGERGEGQSLSCLPRYSIDWAELVRHGRRHPPPSLELELLAGDAPVIGAEPRD